MAEHESCVGASDEWFTPPEIFDALGLRFDLDPAWSSSPHCAVPCARAYAKDCGADGLANPWRGLVWLNPPFGGRFGHVPWCIKFFEHGNGIALIRAYTSSSWWHDLMPRAEMILFPRGKTKFIRGTDMRNEKTGEIYPAGSRGVAPGHGVALIGAGSAACRALTTSKLGMVWDRRLRSLEIP